MSLAAHTFVNLIYCNAIFRRSAEDLFCAAETTLRLEFVERGSQAKNNLNNFIFVAL